MNRLRPSVPNGPTPHLESLSGRKKVTLSPGHSLMDWIRLGRAQGDLSGVGSAKKQVSPAELAAHNTQRDIWMAIRGRVYNLTPYLEYHPGGVDELMRAAGKDGTDLFDEIHNWVNVESMLDKCLVGTAVATTGSKKQVKSVRSRSLGSFGSIKPPVPSPTYGWNQKTTELNICIYTKLEDMRSDFVIVDVSENEFQIEVLIKDFSYFVHIKTPAALLPDSVVTVTKNGTIQVTLSKKALGNWETLGQPLQLHDTYPRTKSQDCKYRPWTLTSNTAVTHDTRLLRFHAPPGCRMCTPIGYHVHIKTDISGMEIARSYTVVTPSLTNPYSDIETAKGKAVYLMVKRYEGGVISPWICSLKPGDKVQMSNFDGNFDLNRLKKASRLICFAAGTGFTSMVRLITYALFDLKDATFPVTLFFYNKTMKDILWRDQMEELVKSYSRFSVTHVLSQELDTSWKGFSGRVCENHVKDAIPDLPPSPDLLFCICGQWAYNDVVENLAKLNDLDEQHMHIFSQIA